MHSSLKDSKWHELDPNHGRMKTLPRLLFLLVAGSLLLAVGSAILFAPHAFHSGNGISLGHNPNLLSEIRAPGGLLASSGVVVLLGAFRQRLRDFAVQLSVLVYAAFGISRLVSIAVDGWPETTLVSAAALELTIAVAGLFIWWAGRRTVDSGR